MPYFKSIIFYQYISKIKVFLQKNAKIRWGHRPQTPVPPAAGGFAPTLPSFGGWGLGPQTPKTATPMRISGYAPALSSSVLCANPIHKYPN